jgi:hypothetical protein
MSITIIDETDTNETVEEHSNQNTIAIVAVAATAITVAAALKIRSSLRNRFSTDLVVPDPTIIVFPTDILD